MEKIPQTNYSGYSETITTRVETMKQQDHEECMELIQHQDITWVDTSFNTT